MFLFHLPTFNTLKVSTIKGQTREIELLKETIHMKLEMNCKRLQVGQFWSARPRGHNRWLHQVRQTILAFHAALHFSISSHQHTTFQLISVVLFPAAAPWLCLAYSPIPRSFSRGRRVGRGFRSFASTQKRNYLLRLQNLRTCICLHLCSLES